MTYPRARLSQRKLADHDALLLRGDMATRALAEQMIAEGRRILAAVPTPTQRARQLGIHHSRAVAIARGHAYKELRSG